jgi:aryl-alcohol dehydrogenase-like predicted oxidoreductase
MALSGVYGRVAKEDALAVIRTALDLGVEHFDTAELYGPYTNEELLAEALGRSNGKVSIATKFGYKLDADGIVGLDSSPAAIRRSVEGSLRRLRRDRVDLLYQHRPDPHVPIEDVVGVMADLVREGKVLRIGLSAADGTILDRAASVYPVAALQNRYSLIDREAESDPLPTVRAQGTVSFVAYSPLARGLLAGSTKPAEERPADDYRRSDSRFSAVRIDASRHVLAPMWQAAERHSVTPAAIAIAWLLSRDPCVYVLPGARSTRQLIDAVRGADIALSAEDQRSLDAVQERV